MKSLFKLILLIINITAAAALLFSGFGGHINPHFSSLPGIALMMLPAIAVAVILLLLIDLFTWRRLAFMPAFVLLFCAVPLWNLCPLNISTPALEPGQRELKLLTYNIYNFNYDSRSSKGDTNFVLSAILDTDPDIVCLQENTSPDPSTWSRFKAQTDSIVNRYPYRKAVSNALSVWSRYPLTDHPLPQPSDPSAFFQCVDVDIEGTVITLYNIHLQSIGLNPEDKQLYGSITRKITSRKLDNARHGILPKLSSAMKTRASQATMLRHDIDSIGGANILVAGDFNDISDCWSQRTIMGRDLHSAFTSAALGPTVTYYANRFYFNIDHVLYSNSMEVLKYERLKYRASDHFPVMVTLSIPCTQ